MWWISKRLGIYKLKKRPPTGLPSATKSPWRTASCRILCCRVSIERPRHYQHQVLWFNTPMPGLRPPFAFIGKNHKSTKPCKSYDLQGFELIWYRFCRDGRIRTCGLHIPNVARYRATLHPVFVGCAKVGF